MDSSDPTHSVKYFFSTDLGPEWNPRSEDPLLLWMPKSWCHPPHCCLLYVSSRWSQAPTFQALLQAMASAPSWTHCVSFVPLKSPSPPHPALQGLRPPDLPLCQDNIASQRRPCLGSSGHFWRTLCDHHHHQHHLVLPRSLTRESPVEATRGLANNLSCLA